MTKDELRNAEQRGYSRGYAAGTRRKEQDAHDATRRKRDVFWRRAFLAALPASISAKGWTCGDKPIVNVKDRVTLAGDIADEAVKRALPHL